MSVVKLWQPRVIGWSVMLGTPMTGFALAAINWYRMGLKRKAYAHFFIGILLTCLMTMANAALDLYITSTSLEVLRLVIFLTLIFATIAYLHTQTAQAHLRLQAEDVQIEPAKLENAIGIGLVMFIIFGNVVASTEAWVTARYYNYVQCNFLELGMSYEKVDATLSSNIGAHTQVNYNRAYEMITDERITLFTTVRFDDYDVQARFGLWIGLGYDEDDKLIWVGRATPYELTPSVCS